MEMNAENQLIPQCSLFFFPPCILQVVLPEMANGTEPIEPSTARSTFDILHTCRKTGHISPTRPVVYPCCCSLLAKVVSVGGSPPEPPRNSSTWTRPVLTIPMSHKIKQANNDGTYRTEINQTNRAAIL